MMMMGTRRQPPITVADLADYEFSQVVASGDTPDGRHKRLVAVARPTAGDIRYQVYVVGDGNSDAIPTWFDDLDAAVDAFNGLS